MYAALLLATLLVDGLPFAAVFGPKNSFAFVDVVEILLLFVLFVLLLSGP